MNNFRTSRRSTTSRLFAVAAIVVVLVSGQGTGQAASTSTAATSTSASSKPKAIDAFTVAVAKSVVTYWGSAFTGAGLRWGTLYYYIIKKDKIVRSPCGPVGDPDAYASAAPAGYCPSNDTVYFSTQWLYNHASNNATTPYGVAEVIAHEVGHAVQARLRLPRSVRVERSELQADCFSALWVRHRVNIGAATTKDRDDARRALQTLGDYNDNSPTHHGTADERVIAWTIGYNRGFKSCIALNPPAGR